MASNNVDTEQSLVSRDSSISKGGNALGSMRLSRQLSRCVSKNDTAVACYNFDVHQLILIFFGRDVATKLSSQMVLYFPTSPN